MADDNSNRDSSNGGEDHKLANEEGPHSLSVVRFPQSQTMEEDRFRHQNDNPLLPQVKYLENFTRCMTMLFRRWSYKVRIVIINKSDTRVSNKEGYPSVLTLASLGLKNILCGNQFIDFTAIHVEHSCPMAIGRVAISKLIVKCYSSGDGRVNPYTIVDFIHTMEVLFHHRELVRFVTKSTNYRLAVVARACIRFASNTQSSFYFDWNTTEQFYDKKLIFCDYGPSGSKKKEGLEIIFYLLHAALIFRDKSLPTANVKFREQWKEIGMEEFFSRYINALQWLQSNLRRWLHLLC